MGYVVALVLVVGAVIAYPAVAVWIILGLAIVWLLRRRSTSTAVAPAPAPAQKVNVQYVTFDDLRDDAALDVVGEQYNAEAVRHFQRASVGKEHQAILRPEPTNQFDRNAIQVLAWTGEGEMSPVGHLRREDALSYRPVFEKLAGKVIYCHAALAARRGGGGFDGIVLHLGTPGELMAELWQAERPLMTDHPWAGATVAFTGASVTLSGAFVGREAQLLLARYAGCVAIPRVTKKAQICVAASANEQTANALKAREYGIAIVVERDFWTGVGIEPTALGTQGRWAQQVGAR